MIKTAFDKALDTILQRGVISPPDLAVQGIRRDYLTSLQEKGLVRKVGRRLYVTTPRSIRA